MAQLSYERFDPLLSAELANSMLRLAERFTRYGTYDEESIQDGFADELPQRCDVAINFAKTGGRFGRRESAEKLVARTNYFRETYAYNEPVVAGIEPFLHHDAFIEAARRIHGRRIIEPNIVYANILVPGQELAIHTDVPEFRGMNRKKDPQWLLVTMHHSGLFDAWRMPIATGVAWFGNPVGGEFVFYPDGPESPPVALPVRHNTAILLDSDSVFHGVDRVSEAKVRLPDLKAGMQLRYRSGGVWTLGTDDKTEAELRWDDLRFSISWKAYCYTDEAERRMVAYHRDDMDRKRALDILVSDLRQRDRIGSQIPEPAELALILIDEYIHYPPPAESAI
jgi:hypothetical protein